jgi:hypothetical protein
MEKFQEALERKFNKGFQDGEQGVYNPGSTFGALRVAYIRGFNEAKGMKVKTKK